MRGNGKMTLVGLAAGACPESTAVIRGRKPLLADLYGWITSRSDGIPRILPGYPSADSRYSCVFPDVGGGDHAQLRLESTILGLRCCCLRLDEVPIAAAAGRQTCSSSVPKASFSSTPFDFLLRLRNFEVKVCWEAHAALPVP